MLWCGEKSIISTNALQLAMAQRKLAIDGSIELRWRLGVGAGGTAMVLLRKHRLQTRGTAKR